MNLSIFSKFSLTLKHEIQETLYIVISIQKVYETLKILIKTKRFYNTRRFYYLVKTILYCLQFFSVYKIVKLLLHIVKIWERKWNKPIANWRKGGRKYELNQWKKTNSTGMYSLSKLESKKKITLVKPNFVLSIMNDYLLKNLYLI